MEIEAMRCKSQIGILQGALLSYIIIYGNLDQ